MLSSEVISSTKLVYVPDAGVFNANLRVRHEALALLNKVLDLDSLLKHHKWPHLAVKQSH